MTANHHILSPEVATFVLTILAEAIAKLPPSMVVVINNSSITVDGKKLIHSDVKPITNPSSASQECVFRIEGKICKITFDGKEVCVTAYKGLRYIHYLIQHPWEDVHCSTLVEMLNGEAPDCGGDDTKEALMNETLSIKSERREKVLTPEQRKGLEMHLKELKEDLTELKNSHEPTDKMESEIEKYEEYLKKVGYGNHAATFKTQADLDRKSVPKTIKSAIKAVNAIHPALGHFLKKSFKYGEFILYKPIKTINWEK